MIKDQLNTWLSIKLIRNGSIYTYIKNEVPIGLGWEGGRVGSHAAK